MKAINPATGETIREYPDHGWEQVEQYLARANRAFQSWRQTSFALRAGLMKAAAAVLRDRTCSAGRP